MFPQSNIYPLIATSPAFASTLPPRLRRLVHQALWRKLKTQYSILNTQYAKPSLRGAKRRSNQKTSVPSLTELKPVTL